MTVLVLVLVAGAVVVTVWCIITHRPRRKQQAEEGDDMEMQELAQRLAELREPGPVAPPPRPPAPVLPPAVPAPAVAPAPADVPPAPGTPVRQRRPSGEAQPGCSGSTPRGVGRGIRGTGRGRGKGARTRNALRTLTDEARTVVGALNPRRIHQP